MFLCRGVAIAQFNIQEDSISFNSPSNSPVFYSTIELENTSDSSIEIEWEIKNVEIPTVWEYTYTVGFDWYGDTTLSGKYLLEPSKNGTSFIVVQYYPNKQADTGRVAIQIRMTQDTSQSYNLQFEGIAYLINSFNKIEIKSPAFYPNPLKMGELPSLIDGIYTLYDLKGTLIWTKSKLEIRASDFNRSGRFLLIRRNLMGQIEKHFIQVVQ